MNTNTINVKVKRNKMSLFLAFGAGAAVGAGGVLIAQKVQEKQMERMLNLIIEDDIQSTVNEWNDMDDDEDVLEDDEDFEDEPIDQSKSSSDNENLNDLDDERPEEPIEEELDERGEMTDVNIVHPESSDRSDVPEDSEDIPEDTVTIDVADVVVLSDRSSIKNESTTVESSVVETTDGSESELVELKTTIMNDETGDNIPAVSSSEEEVAVTVVEAEDETTSEGLKNGPSPEVVTKIQQMMENMNAIGSLLEEKRFMEAKQMYRIELLPITEDEFIKKHRPEIIPIITKIGDDVFESILANRRQRKKNRRRRNDDNGDEE